MLLNLEDLMQVNKVMKRALFSIFLLLLLASCEDVKYIDLIITSQKRGWCFVIFTEDTTKLKLSKGANYKLYLDSNNVAYLPLAILDKGYNNRIYNSQGVDIKGKTRLFGHTSFDQKRKMLEFYYLTEEELKMPDVTWIEPNNYIDWVLVKKSEEKLDSLKEKGY